MDLLNVKQVCSVLDISTSTMNRWIQENRLIKIPEGGQNYFNKFEVLKLIPTQIVISNHKGGVGKTALSLNIAQYFSFTKKLDKILMIDFDPQSNLSKHLIGPTKLYDDNNKILCLADYFTGNKKLPDIIYKYDDIIDLLPAKLMMSNILQYDAKELEKRYSPEFFDLFKKYQLVIFDTPPAINVFSKLAVILANYIIAPVLLDEESKWGIDDALDFISTYMVPGRLIDFKILINQTSRSAAIRNDLKNHYSNKYPNNIFKNVLPEYIGHVERGRTFDNIFEQPMEKDTKENIMSIMTEIEEWIYVQRPIAG